MSTDLVPLAILMALVTYPSRVLLLLLPGARRLPSTLHLYLRLVAPAVLASLAAVSIMVVLDVARGPSFHVGPEWLAVGLCVAIVAFRRGSLFIGLVLAAALIASIRALGLAATP